MKSKIVVKKQGAMLIAVNDFARETLRSVPDGKLIMVTASTPRNPGQLAFYQTILTRIIESGAWSRSRRELVKHLLRATGYVNVTYRNGQPEIEYRSVGFESMTQAEFSDFLEKAKNVIQTEILAGADHETLREELFSGEKSR